MKQENMPSKKPWQICEDMIRDRYEAKGFTTIPTRVGSDFIAISPTQRLTFVETKLGCGEFSKRQREMESWAIANGFGYAKESCTCARPATKSVGILE